MNETNQQPVSGMWGALAASAGSLFSTGVNAFSPKVRENNLAIAEANARIAEASAVSTTNTTKIDPKLLIGLGLVLVVIVLMAVMHKKG